MIAEQIQCFLNQIVSEHNEARSSGRVLSLDINALACSLRNIIEDVGALERQAEQASAGLSSEYVTALVTNARWILSSDSMSPMVRELAEAVLVLAGRTNPS